MKGLKFLSLLTFFTTIASVIYIFNGREDFYSLFEDIEKGSQHTLTYSQKIQSYFKYADSWNYLTLLAFIAILIFLFVLNDYLFGRIFQYNKKDKSGETPFVTGGMVWFSRMVLSLVLVLFEFIFFSNLIILLHSKDKVIDNLSQITEKKVILLLGTNKRTKSGSNNIYYYARIEAVANLYKAGKIKRIIISGDNRRKDYNEPRDMYRDLIRSGVPKKIIFLDYAGFRTLDSIVRLKNEYHVNDVVIVSQQFHVERALFLSWFYNVNAKAFTAKGDMTKEMFKRELLAKPKVLMDLFLFNMQPKFGKTNARAGISFNKQKDLILMGTVFTLFIISGLLLKNTFVY